MTPISAIYYHRNYRLPGIKVVVSSELLSVSLFSKMKYFTFCKMYFYMCIPLNINDCILVKKILQEFAGTNTVNLFYPNKNTTIDMSILILKNKNIRQFFYYLCFSSYKKIKKINISDN